MFSVDGCLRSLNFHPGPFDVVVCGPQRSGENVVLCILSLLAVNGNNLDDSGNRITAKPHVKWIESKKFDKKPEILKQAESGNFQTFKTLQSCRAIGTRVNGNGKYIAVFRDPVSYKAAWYRYIERYYEYNRSGNPSIPFFSSRYSPDDFANVPATFVSSYDTTRMFYEQNLNDWFKLKDKDNVLIVFWEDIVTNPGAVVDDIACFMDVDVDPSTKSKILKHIEPTKMSIQYTVTHNFYMDTRDTKTSKSLTISYESAQEAQKDWDRCIRRNYPNLKTYKDLYESVKEQPYPVDVAPPISAAELNFQQGCFGCILASIKNSFIGTRSSNETYETKATRKDSKFSMFSQSTYSSKASKEPNSTLSNIMDSDSLFS